MKISWTGNLAWNDVQASKSNQELKKNLCGPVVWIEFSVWMIVSNSLWSNTLSVARPSACCRQFLKKKELQNIFFDFAMQFGLYVDKLNVVNIKYVDKLNISLGKSCSVVFVWFTIIQS